MGRYDEGHPVILEGTTEFHVERRTEEGGEMLLCMGLCM